MRFQELVHKFESATGRPYLKFALAVLGAVLLLIVYDLRCFRNLSSPEAMDAAQLGRNLAEGEGYTTRFIRPFSLYLLDQKHPERAGTNAAPAELHPDLANPPVYPVVLAGAMKVLKFQFTIPADREKARPFWSSFGQFWRYQPDFLIAVFNQALFLIVVLLVFFWAKRLFDAAAAWVSAVLLLGTELLWRISASGLSTMLLLLIFMGVIWCLTLLESEARETGRGPARAFLLAAAAGALIGLGGLTRYAFIWMILPALVFLLLFTGAQRPRLSLLLMAAFAVVVTPWIIRNLHLSGAVFGTATYQVVAGTDYFPENTLERSLTPNALLSLYPIQSKLFANLRLILQNDLFKFAGGWITAFFLASLMMGYRNVAVRRMRAFGLMSLGLLIVAEALSRAPSTDTGEIHGDNLLVLLAPLAAVFGAGFFLSLLEQVSFKAREIRYAAVATFGVVASLPLMLALGSPVVPLVYPPYHPQIIQETAALVQPDEWLMSDVPWAVAWYGRRPCVWFTLHALPDRKDPAGTESLAAVNERYGPVHAVYLTSKTTDGRYYSDHFRLDDNGWGALIRNLDLDQALPIGFPLREVAPGYLREQQLFVSDRRRW